MTAKQLAKELTKERHDEKNKKVIVYNGIDGTEFEVMSVENDPANNCVRLIVGADQTELTHGS